MLPLHSAQSSKLVEEAEEARGKLFRSSSDPPHKHPPDQPSRKRLWQIRTAVIDTGKHRRKAVVLEASCPETVRITVDEEDPEDFVPTHLIPPLPAPAP